MMTVKSKIIFFFVFVLSSCSLQFVKSFTNKRAPSSIEQYGGSLGGLIQKFKYKTTGDFYAPAPVLLSKFSDLLVKIEKGHAELAHTEEFKFLKFNQKKIICLFPKKNQGQGIFCINRDAEYDHLIAAPHPVIDQGSAPVALKAFLDLSLRYLFISSSSRCLSDKYSSCSGMTSVCGKREHYRQSDPAHNENNYFQELTKYHHQRYPKAYHFQIHACGEKSCPSKKENNILARLSVGSKDVLDESALSNKLTSIMNQQIQVKNSMVLSCNQRGEESYRLCASTNVQGRYLNDPHSNSCTERASTDIRSKFLHIEINHDLRNYSGKGDLFNPEFLIQSLRRIL